MRQVQLDPITVSVQATGQSGGYCFCMGYPIQRSRFWQLTSIFRSFTFSVIDFVFNSHYRKNRQDHGEMKMRKTLVTLLFSALVAASSVQIAAAAQQPAGHHRV